MSAQFLYIEEVAQLLRVPVSSVRFWLRTGKLASLRPGRRVLVEREALDRMLRESQQYRNAPAASTSSDEKEGR